MNIHALRFAEGFLSRFLLYISQDLEDDTRKPLKHAQFLFAPHQHDQRKDAY
jgi:hypothetical protein